MFGRRDPFDDPFFTGRPARGNRQGTVHTGRQQQLQQHDPFAMMDNMMSGMGMGMGMRGGMGMGMRGGVRDMMAQMENDMRMMGGSGSGGNGTSMSSMSSFSSSSSTMSADGRPVVRQHHVSQRRGPSGAVERHESAMDSRTGYKRHTVQRQLADGRGRKISKAYYGNDGGREETHDELVNMDETDAAQFDRDWQAKARAPTTHRFLGGGGGGGGGGARASSRNRSRLSDRSYHRHHTSAEQPRQLLSGGSDRSDFSDYRDRPTRFGDLD